LVHWFIAGRNQRVYFGRVRTGQELEIMNNYELEIITEQLPIAGMEP
jgi:hypothetical protein